MDDIGFISAIGKFGLIPAGLIYLASWLFKHYSSTRADTAGFTARTDILESIGARLVQLERTQKMLNKSLDEEIVKRREAEDWVARLTRRICVLEDQLRRAGITPEM